MTGKQLLKEFKDNGISHDAKDTRFTLTLEFQDFIGHMNNEELIEFYKGLDQNERKNFIWAVSVCLSPDTLIDVLKSTAIRLERRKLYDDFEQNIGQREDDLFKREQTFRECKKPIHKKIAALKSEIETLNNRVAWHMTCNDSLRDSNYQLHKRLRPSELKAANFDNVKAALSLMLESA